MKFKKIILKDFFRFYGKQEIDLSVDNNKTVVVLIGENGRGKTTILSAFNFVLYGKLLEPLIEDNMLNYKKRAELGKNLSTEASVELLFEEAKTNYIMKRYIDFKKDEDGNIVKLSSKPKACVYRVRENGDIEELDLKMFENRILIPENLSSFFFFDGERINRLAKVDGKAEIKKAILNILGISNIDNAKSDLSKVKKILINESKKYSNDIVYDELVNEIENAKDELEKKNKQNERNEQEIKNVEEAFNKITEQLRNSDNNTVKELERNERKNQGELKLFEMKLSECEKEIKKHIGENFKYYLSSFMVKDVDELLEDKKIQGVLPSNIKETFIDDLIKKKVCICGTCIEEGSKEYNSIIALKEKAGSKELDNAYYKLKALVKKINKTKNEFYSKLDSYLTDREYLKEKIYNINEELKNISEKLKNTDIEAIRMAEENRDRLRKTISLLNQKKGKLESEIEKLKKEIQIKEKKLTTLESNNKHIIKLQKEFNIISELETLNDEFRTLFTEIARKELDNRIKDVFSKITNKDYRIPALTKNFELKITSKYSQIELDEEDKKDEILSTGEGQITSLSFIGALVSYAKDKKDDKILSKLTAEEYPIVMDSPFGNLDEIHTKNVAKNIGKLSSQVIIVVSRKQWEGYVHENIIDQVKRKYIMVDGVIEANSGEYTLIREMDI